MSGVDCCTGIWLMVFVASLRYESNGTLRQPTPPFIPLAWRFSTRMVMFTYMEATRIVTI